MPDEFDAEGGDILEAESSPPDTKDGKGNEQEQPTQKMVSEKDLNALRSVKDQEVRAERRAREQEAQRARLLEAQLATSQGELESLWDTLETIDPKSTDAARMNQRIRQLETELEVRRDNDAANEAWREFYSYHEQAARAAGIDTSDQRLQTAILTGDVVTIEKAKDAIRREAILKETQMAGNKRSPDREERAERLRSAEQEGELDMLPPGGGAGGSATDRLMADYKSDLAKAQGNVRRVLEVKRKYRNLNLDV